MLAPIYHASLVYYAKLHIDFDTVHIITVNAYININIYSTLPFFYFPSLENYHTQTHRVDGVLAQVPLGDVGLLHLRAEPFLGEELQQSRVVGRGSLRRRSGALVPLSQQGLSSTVDLWGEEQLGNGRLQVLFFVLVPVQRLPELHGDVFWESKENLQSDSPSGRTTLK